MSEQPENYVEKYIEEDLAEPRMRGMLAMAGVVIVTFFILFVVANGFAAI